MTITTCLIKPRNAEIYIGFSHSIMMTVVMIRPIIERNSPTFLTLVKKL